MCGSVCEPLAALLAWADARKQARRANAREREGQDQARDACISDGGSAVEVPTSMKCPLKDQVAVQRLPGEEAGAVRVPRERKVDSRSAVGTWRRSERDRDLTSFRNKHSSKSREQIWSSGCRSDVEV